MLYICVSCNICMARNIDFSTSNWFYLCWWHAPSLAVGFSPEHFSATIARPLLYRFIVYSFHMYFDDFFTAAKDRSERPPVDYVCFSVIQEQAIRKIPFSYFWQYFKKFRGTTFKIKNSSKSGWITRRWF